MGINWHIPLFNQLYQSSYVVKMSVSEDNGFRPCMGTKALFHNGNDVVGRMRHACINENKFSARLSYKGNIDDLDRMAINIRPYLFTAAAIDGKGRYELIIFSVRHAVFH